MSKGETTRTAILEYASGEAARLGLGGVSIGALAAGLGMSKSGVFAHFASKEALEAAIVDFAAEQFTELVIRPVLRVERGATRVRALLEGWLAWDERQNQGQGCVFVAACFELDDRPGLARNRLVAQQQDWLEFLANVARVAVARGEFRADFDPVQFAHEANGIMLALHHARRLLGDPLAVERSRRALERLVGDARTPPTESPSLAAHAVV